MKNYDESIEINYKLALYSTARYWQNLLAQQRAIQIKVSITFQSKRKSRD